jgi:hypothetical protein
METVGLLIIGAFGALAAGGGIYAGVLDPWLRPKSNGYKFTHPVMAPAQSIMWAMGRTTVEWVNTTTGLTKFEEYEIPLPGFIPFVNTFPTNPFALMAGDEAGFEWVSTNNPFEEQLPCYISKNEIESVAMKCEEMLRSRSVDKQVINNLRNQLSDSIKFPTGFLREIGTEMASIRKTRLGRGIDAEGEEPLFDNEGSGGMD